MDQDKALGSPIEHARALEKYSGKCAATGAYDVSLATAYQQANALDDADRAARAGLTVKSEYRPNLLMLLARSQMLRGKVDDAYQMALDITRQYPSFAPAYGLLGQIDSNLKRWDQAYESGKRLVELNPVAISYLAPATSLYQLHRLPETVAAVNHALELEPERIGKAVGLVEGVYALILLKRRDEAASLLKRHMQANPNWQQSAPMVNAAKELGVLQ